MRILLGSGFGTNCNKVNFLTSSVRGLTPWWRFRLLSYVQLYWSTEFSGGNSVATPELDIITSALAVSWGYLTNSRAVHTSLVKKSAAASKMSV